MPQIATILTWDEQKAFSTKLKALVDAGCAREPGRTNHPGLGSRLKKEMGWPSLARLSRYAKGQNFPTADTIIKIGKVIGEDWLALLKEAGYYGAVVDIIFELSLYRETKSQIEARIHSDSRMLTDGERAFFAVRWPQRIALNYAVGMFPRATEHTHGYHSALTAVLFSGLIESAKLARDRRKTLHPFLKHALAALAEPGLRRDAARNIAGEWVREWALSVDPQLTAEAEQQLFHSRIDPRGFDVLLNGAA